MKDTIKPGDMVKGIEYSDWMELGLVVSANEPLPGVLDDGFMIHVFATIAIGKFSINTRIYRSKDVLEKVS
jgi:hypothetical protein